MTQIQRLMMVACITLNAGGGGAHAAPPVRVANDHPLVGVWRFEMPDHSCTETYLIRADGSSAVSSGQEHTESDFEVSAKPDSQGFYAWTDRIVKTNGKPDCAGGTSPVGRQSTIYVRMSPRADRMILCAEANLRTCIGPLVRAAGQKL